MALCSPDQMAQALGFECTVTGYGMFSSEPAQMLLAPLGLQLPYRVVLGTAGVSRGPGVGTTHTFCSISVENSLQIKLIWDEINSLSVLRTDWEAKTKLDLDRMCESMKMTMAKPGENGDFSAGHMEHLPGSFRNGGSAIIVCVLEILEHGDITWKSLLPVLQKKPRPCHAVLVLTKVPWEILITPQKTIDSRATLSGCVILFHLQHHKPTSSAACEAVMPYLYLDCLLVVSSFVHNPVNVAAPSGFETGLRTDRTEVTSTFLVALATRKVIPYAQNKQPENPQTDVRCGNFTRHIQGRFFLLNFDTRFAFLRIPKIPVISENVDLKAQIQFD
ncbi:hypothetical protein Q9966_011305 [Columba livia]|nr:hypothetical protein Q9966_011305 [Columba livia]